MVTRTGEPVAIFVTGNIPVRVSEEKTCILLAVSWFVRLILTYIHTDGQTVRDKGEMSPYLLKIKKNESM